MEDLVGLHVEELSHFVFENTQQHVDPAFVHAQTVHALHPVFCPFVAKLERLSFNQSSDATLVKVSLVDLLPGLALVGEPVKELSPGNLSWVFVIQRVNNGFRFGFLPLKLLG